ncbi:BREX-2 system phosphatase PglZ [Synechococcus sp. PCC 7336]|uniref:BREX-2 system phosphatase PglZ n=1 Tax=Synechococcus sp. PCC 7336 TaxID=195250 RepID=UPI000348ABA2|nr:BREX-2 system phosphatase PglZ [Synechococcus sp. PCC 7336]
MISAPTFSQIKAQVTAILQRSPNSQVIGIHAQGRWTGDRQQFDGDRCYSIDRCDSPLAMRIALQKGHREREADGTCKHAVQVLVTPLAEQDLAEDILMRLAKQRLFAIDPWQIVKSLFRATNIDPRLIPHQWIPEALMEWMPANRYSPVMGGFLDAEIVWPLLLQQSLHLQANRPDLVAILQWSANPDHVARYQQASEEFQSAACKWLIGLAGSTTETILHCVAHNPRPDALPLGLAAEVMYHPATQNKLDKAIGKLEERFLAGLAPQPSAMQIWSTAAQKALKLLPTDAQQAAIQRSDAILTEIGAEDFAYLSTVSEQGLNQHLTNLSQYLFALIERPTQATLDKLSQTYHTIKSHQRAIEDLNSRRLQRLDMALRLAQWIVNAKASPPSEPKSLEDAIAYHLREGGFIDWARLTLPLAETHRELSTAYGKLFDTVTTIRETQSQRFAKLLKDWTAIGSTRKSVLPVEQVLETIVAPLAETNPVLFIVIDGMSLAVGYELLSDLTQRNWNLIHPEAQDTPIQAGLATIPSVTAVSRTSLFCGQLQQGQANQEKQGFTKHATLLKHCKRSAPPLLFHKAALRASDNPILSEELHSAVESDKHQIVGVVINAVDDLLSKGDQVDTAWTFARIKVLQPLLQAAQNAKRLVILTSDHGHVLDNGAQYQSAKGGERWRIDNGNPSDQELQLAGERVIASDTTSVIVPWTEKLRYCREKKNGYHGGITPQETIVPIAVLAPTGTCPQDWRETTILPPCWWDTTPIDTPEPTLFKDSQSTQKNADLGPLFNVNLV